MAIANNPDPHGNYYQRQAWKALRAPQIAAEKAAAAARQMTCQCCARPIFAETGLIAHHGYERPGQGWQTASCIGARKLPFEVDRKALGELIELLKSRVERLGRMIEEMQAEIHPLTWTYRDKNVVHPKYGRGHDGETTVSITRDTFATAFEAYKAAQRYRTAGNEPTYDSLKAMHLKQLGGRLKATQDDLKIQEGRYAAWKQTHRKGGEGEATWVKL